MLFESNTLRIVGSGSTLRPAGEIDASNYDAWSSALAGATDRDRDLEVDLSELRFLDIGGARVLHRAALRFAERDRQVVLRSPAPRVGRLMGVLGWDDLECFRIEPELEDPVEC